MIPPGCSTEFKKVCDRVSELHSDWKMFRYLFADHPDHFNIFNEIDPKFFLKVQSLFNERICMFLCRLGDPAKQGRNTNLTLESLLDISAETDASVKTSLEPLLKDFRASTKKFRELRNKYYGHYDRESELGTTRALFSRSEVETALRALREFMNGFRLHFGESRMMYEYVVTNSNGEGLMWALRQSETNPDY